MNGLALVIKDRERIASAGGLLQGYQPIVWLLIVNNTLVGLAISAILKFANNLVRVFAHTAAMLLTMFLECVLMGAAFSPQLVVSIVIVSSSTFLYNLHPPPKPSAVAVRRGEPALLKEAKEDELANAVADGVPTAWEQQQDDAGGDSNRNGGAGHVELGHTGARAGSACSPEIGSPIARQ